jgi:hypothetical protein
MSFNEEDWRRRYWNPKRIENEKVQANLSKLLGENLFINYIFTNIQSCLFSETFKGEDICVAQPSDEKDRLGSECNKRHSTIVEYNKDDLYIYGGAAFVTYLTYIHNRIYGEKYGPQFSNTMQLESMKTNDIDFAWWPRVYNTGKQLFIYKYELKKIREFYESITNKIKEWFNLKRVFFIDLLREKVLPSLLDENFSIIVNLTDMNRGVNFITISFIINNTPYKIAEIAIHDGASSQTTKFIKTTSGFEKPFIPVSRVGSDPIYVNDDQIITMTPEGSNNYINVPKFPRFIYQQIIAYKNLSKMGDRAIKSMYTIYDRLSVLILYLDNLLNEIDFSRSSNTNDKTLYNELFLGKKLIDDFFKEYPPKRIPESFLGGRRKTQKKGHQLFNDNPRGRPRTRGIGYGTAKRARNSITRLKGKSKTYKRQVATTMYYRAKHHKYQNQGMRDAMKIWKKYMNQLEK